MKQSVILKGALLLMAAACQREVLEPRSEPVSSTAARTVSILAGEAGTRTEIAEEADGFALSWSQGDRIDLVEVIYENFPGGGKEDLSPAETYPSEPLSIAAETATFQVNLGERENPHGGKFHYIGVYPSGKVYDARQKEEDDHAVLTLSFPYEQEPTAGSFDPRADLLVSRIVDSDERADGSMQMQFARVGTIVKMTLKGLTPGEQVIRGNLVTDPEDWASDYLVTYDPVTTDLDYMKSEGCLPFFPQEVYAGKDGSADIWLRTRSGVISSWFRVEITTTQGKQEKQYVKEVDLQAAGRTITLLNGGLTSFGVTVSPLDEVTFPDNHSVEKTQASISQVFDCLVKGITEEQVDANAEMGLVWLTEEMYYAFGDRFRLSDVPAERILNQYGTYHAEYDPAWSDGPAYHITAGVSLENLDPGTSYYFVKYLKWNGNVYFSAPYSVDTKMAAPVLVDLGLPSGTLWAETNMGSSSPSAAGDYYAFGETEPGTGHYNQLSNKYWHAHWLGTGSSYEYLASQYAYYERYYGSNLGQETMGTDLLFELLPEDDAAYAQWGEGWRTPTRYDFQELLEKCTHVENPDGSTTWTGPNGNSITLPACGHYQGSHSRKYYSFYLTSSLSVDDGSSLNEIWVFWNGTGDYELLDSWYANSAGGLRGGYYNIRPVYGGANRETYRWRIKLDKTPIFSENSNHQPTVTLGATFETGESGYTYTISVKPDDGFAGMSQELASPAQSAVFELTPGKTYYYQASAGKSGQPSIYSEIRKLVR